MDDDSALTTPASGEVTLRVPAHRDFVATIRALARSTAILVDLSVDDVEDLQMAVDEAATLLLPLVTAGANQHLEAALEVGADELRVRLAIRAAAGASIDRTSLAWAMLSALDPTVSVQVSGDELSILMSRSRAGVAP